MKVVLIPCHNGLGHIHRMNILGSYLSKKNFRVDFLLNKEKKIKKYTQINYIDKKLPTKYSDYELNKYKKKLLDLDLSKYNLIFSDNYYEFSYNKKNLVALHANFFWSQINKSKNNIRFLKKKLKKNFIFFSNYIFSMIKNKNLKIKKVGFFGSFQGRSAKKNKFILISNGTAQPNLFLIKKIIDLIVNSDLNLCIYLDEYAYKIFKGNYSNIYLARFDDKMFRSIVCGVIRPGIGTITECLRYGVPIISLNLKCNAKNYEIRHNSNILEKKKLGFNLKNLKKFITLIKLIQNTNQKIFLEKCSNLKWNAEEIILNDTIKKYKRFFYTNFI